MPLPVLEGVFEGDLEAALLVLELLVRLGVSVLLGVGVLLRSGEVEGLAERLVNDDELDRDARDVEVLLAVRTLLTVGDSAFEFVVVAVAESVGAEVIDADGEGEAESVCVLEVEGTAPGDSGAELVVLRD